MAIDVKLKSTSINFTLKDHSYGVLRKDNLNAEIYKTYEDLWLDECQLAEQLGIFCTLVRPFWRGWHTMSWLKFYRARLLLTTGSPLSKITTDGLFAHLFAV